MKNCYKMCFISMFMLAAYPLSALALDEPLPGQSGEGESLLPEDTIETDTASETYGVAGGYVHPYITLAGEWTDTREKLVQEIGEIKLPDTDFSRCMVCITENQGSPYYNNTSQFCGRWFAV